MDPSDYARGYAARRQFVRDADLRRESDYETLIALWLPLVGPERTSFMVRQTAKKNRVLADKVLHRWGIW